jgi:hypothetical protein
MVVISKSFFQNPLEDEKWQKKFTDSLKKDIQKTPKRKSSSQRIISEIICTSKDIGEPNYPPKPKRSKR